MSFIIDFIVNEVNILIDKPFRIIDHTGFVITRLKILLIVSKEKRLFVNKISTFDIVYVLCMCVLFTEYNN